MIGKRIKQINNLRLTLGADGMYRVYSPDNRCLEEFATRVSAERWMHDVTGFRKPFKN